MQSNEQAASPGDDVREKLANTLSKVFGYGPLAKWGESSHTRHMRERADAILAEFEVHLRGQVIDATSPVEAYEYTGAQMDGTPDTAGLRMWGSEKPDAAFRRVKAGPWEPNPAARPGSLE